MTRGARINASTGIIGSTSGISGPASGSKITRAIDMSGISASCENMLSNIIIGVLIKRKIPSSGNRGITIGRNMMGMLRKKLNRSPITLTIGSKTGTNIGKSEVAGPNTNDIEMSKAILITTWGINVITPNISRALIKGSRIGRNGPATRSSSGNTRSGKILTNFNKIRIISKIGATKGTRMGKTRRKSGANMFVAGNKNRNSEKYIGSRIITFNRKLNRIIGKFGMNKKIGIRGKFCKKNMVKGIKKLLII